MHSGKFRDKFALTKAYILCLLRCKFKIQCMDIFRQFLKAKTRLIVEMREAEVITLTYLISLSIYAPLSNCF
jgi:hypothetical protein